MQSLEQRRLYSSVIEGTDGDDVFIIRVEDDNVIHLNFNGGVEIVNAPADGFVHVSGYGGNDKFILQNTGNVRFTLSGFAGDDEYTIGQGDLSSDIRRNVIISEAIISPNHGGRDTVTLDDSLGNGTLFTVDNRQVRVTSPHLPVIECQMLPDDKVKLVCSQDNDIVEVRKLMPNFAIELGDGDDLIDFGGPDHVVEPSFPVGCTIDPGSGNDLLVIDDSSTLSDRTSINIEQVSTTVGQPRWMVLDTVGVTRAFDRMRIKTHALPDDQPEVVTFSGRDCPAHNVTVVGNSGADKVLIGSFLDPIWTAGLYTSQIALTLDTGDNQVEVNESDDALGHNWDVFEDRIVSGILTIRNELPVVGTTGVANVLVRGTRFADHFNIVESGLYWNLTLAGGQGDDLLQQTPLLAPSGGKYDLDDNFVGYVKFDGGSGVDSVVLSDLDDELGDADRYIISRSGIRKGDFQDPVPDSMLELSFVDRITLWCDDDTNDIQFDLGGTTFAEIFGGGGDDRFINKSEAVVPSNVMVNSLGMLARLHGGDGNDRLQLDDGAGGAGDYELGAAAFGYTRDSITRTVEFDGMSRIDVNGSNAANTAILRAKPQDAILSFFVNGGDDTLIVGGGDLDASGLHGSTLLGGAGNDKIVFDDALDDHAGFDADTLTINFQTLTKDGVVIGYGAFESQKVITSGVMNGPLAFPNTVRVHGIDMPTEIVDTPGFRSTNVEVGNGPFGLSQVLAPLKLTSSDAMDVTVFDTLSTTNKQFVIGATNIRQNNSPATLDIDHSGLDGISIIAGGTNDQFIIEAVAAGEVVFVNGGGGDDLVSVGNGSAVGIRGPVHFAGGAGANDKVIFSNLLDFATAPIDSRLTSSSFRAGDGPLHQFFNGVEQVQVGFSSLGGADLAMESVTQAVTVIGGGGDDRVTIRNLLNNVFLNGAGQQSGDSLLIDDSTSTTPDRYALDLDNVIRKNAASGGPAVAVAGLEAVELRAGEGHNQVHVETAPFDLAVYTNGGNDSIVVNDSTGVVRIHTGGEVANAPGAPLGDSFSVGIDNDAIPAAVSIGQDDQVILFQVGAAGTLRLDNNAVLRKAPTNLFPLPLLLRGTLDLGGGALIYDEEGSPQAFRQWITAGRNGGTWDGRSPTGAITSSQAAATADADGVGYGRGTEVALSQIGSFTINPGDMVLRYTIAGDADLNGRVDIADFARLAASFNSTSVQWTSGDFDYDTVTGIGDFAQLANHFNRSIPIGSARPGAQAIASGSERLIAAI